MSVCYQLVGVPGAGKSTWLDNQNWIKGFVSFGQTGINYWTPKSDYVIVSTDYFVERFARRMGLTYSEVFDKVMPRAIRLMMRRVQKAQSEGRRIIWDQTSTTLASRKRKFNALPDYEHVAVVFKTPDWAELERRLSNRPNKVVPLEVVKGMIDNFEMPTEAEGFKEIWYAD
jgi:predicted kinase